MQSHHSLLASYLLDHLQIKENGGDEMEALKLIIEKPCADAIRNYPNNVPNSVRASLHFNELFRAGRCLQTTINYYEETSKSLPVGMWKAVNNLIVHWHLRNFGRLPPLNEQIKPPYYQEIKELKRRKALITREIGILYKRLQNGFQTEDEEEETIKIDELITKEVFYAHLKPNFWQQNRGRILLYLCLAAFSYRYLTTDLGVLVSSMKGALFGMKSLWINWIYEPFVALWQSIRYKKGEFITISPQALEADKESLGRMISNYAGKFEIAKEQLETLIDENDYQIFRNEYEKEVAKPRNIFFGNAVMFD